MSRSPFKFTDLGLIAFGLVFIVVWFMTGCQSVESKQPEPMKPDVIETPAVEPEEPEIKPETPDQTFVREFDACWAVYTECQKTRTKDECFPAMEKCGVLAYRKLKKARGA